MKEKKTGGKWGKLVWPMIAVALVAIIALGLVYVNVNNSLNSALRNSLHTFARNIRVAYVMANDSTVYMNVSLGMENPTTYFLKVNAIALAFWVDGEYIGSLTVRPNQTLPSGEKTHFDFVRHITNEAVIDTLHESTYELKLDGKIGTSTSYLFVQASWERSIIDFTRTVPGIHQAKS